jgi:fatty acid desaturase
MGDRGARVRSTMSDTFWILVLSIVVLFAFFIALGAFSPGEVVWLTLAVLGLALLWAAHAVWDARHRSGRDPATIRNRERRGF